MDVPLGFKFHPEPYECLEYLTHKVMGCPLPCNGFIFDLNPYNIMQVPDIFSAVENKGDLYLFTKLSRKGKTGSKNVNRRVGKGTWRGSQNRDVRDRNGRRLIGKATDLKYIEKGSINDSRYLMTEYTLLNNTPLQYDPLKDYVLCHLYQSPRWKKVHNSSNQETADLHTPSPGATELISSVMELDMEMPIDMPSTSASNVLFVEPLAKETAYSQSSDETSFDPDIINTLLSNEFDIDSLFNDPSLNDCPELTSITDPFEFSQTDGSPFFGALYCGFTV